MAKKIFFTDEQKRELLSLKVDKKYTNPQLIEHVRQAYNIPIARIEAINKNIDRWQEQVDELMKDRVDKIVATSGMDHISRIERWGKVRRQCVELQESALAALREKLQDVSEIDLQTAIDTYVKLHKVASEAEATEAELCGLKKDEVVKHEVTFDLASCFQRIREVKKLGNAVDVEYEHCESGPA